MGNLRTQRRLVVVLFLLVVVRGAFWAVATIAPSPIDEMQHFDYVRSLARGDGVPTAGVDHLDDEILAFAKDSATFEFRSAPFPGDLDDPAWDGADPQYEAIQGPTYYALLTPFYWLGRPGGTAGSLYAIRLGSVLLGALAIPAAWLLTRRLVPKRPEAWLLPPILLTFVNAVSSGAATIGNDTIVLTGSAWATVVLLRGLERPRIASALGAGLLAGLVLLGKTTALPMIPLLALLAWPTLREAWKKGSNARERLVPWVLAYGVAFTIPFGLWTIWNLHAYGAFTGAEAADRLTGALQYELPRSLDSLRAHVGSIRYGVWVSQFANLFTSYRYVWEASGAVLIVGGLVLAWRRRQADEVRAIAWGTIAYPITVVTIIAMFVGLFGDVSVLLGRYCWVALVPLTVAMGVGASMIGGRRGGLALVLVVVAVASWVERTDAHKVMAAYYENGLAGPGLVPVVDQSYSDGFAEVEAAVIDVGCPVEVIDLGLERPPETLRIVTLGGSIEATRESDGAPRPSRYRLPAPTQGRLVVPLERERIGVSLADREPDVSLIGRAGDPLVRVHCRGDHAREVRFAQLYDDGHPPVSRTVLRRAPEVMAAAVTWFATMAVCWWAELALRDRRRRRSISGAR